MINKGEEWGKPATTPADHEVAGSDADLATWIAHSPGALVEFRPDPGSDLARAVGLEPGAPRATEIAMDALVLADGTTAVNCVTLGPPPDRLGRFARRLEMTVRIDGNEIVAGRATSVVVAVGQWLRGSDLVPRGHPGDGRFEVQVYRLRPEERTKMRRRLACSEHVPHPRIIERSGQAIEVVANAPLALEVDGIARPATTRFEARIRPGAYRLLV